MKRKDTKTRLLDVAEDMFAQKGFNNTSMRSLTGKAGANLAAVNYHFGSKEGLLQAVLERRLLPLNRIRRQRLEEVMLRAQQKGQLPEVRELLRGYIEPMMALRRSSKGARYFIIIISRALGDPDPTVRSSFLALINPILRYLRECLTLALPFLAKRELFWRYNFALGSITHVLYGLDKQELFSSEMIPEDTDILVEMMLDYLTAGMQAEVNGARA